jgi:broad specificity phosphatase PhoE
MQLLIWKPVVLLARHATPNWNLPGMIYHRPPGPPLVPQGDEEAVELAKFLKTQRTRKIYSSPLERCLQTARVARARTKALLVVTDDLIEVQPGEIGQTILDRSWSLFEKAWQESRLTGPVTLVTHGGVVNVLLRRLGMSAEDLKRNSIFDHNNPIPPAGVWRVTGDIEESKFDLKLVFVPNRKPEAVAAD